MTLFSRSRTITPLSQGVESLLRGLPPAAPYDSARAKMSLLAAFERGSPAVRGGEGFSIFRALRVAVPAGAVAAGVVLGVGVFGEPRMADLDMARRHDLSPRSGFVAGTDVAEVRLPVVERPRMPVFVSALGDGPDAP
jgi:hypothetical protein